MAVSPSGQVLDEPCPASSPDLHAVNFWIDQLTDPCIRQAVRFLELGDPAMAQQLARDETLPFAIFQFVRKSQRVLRQVASVHLLHVAVLFGLCAIGRDIRPFPRFALLLPVRSEVPAVRHSQAPQGPRLHQRGPRRAPELPPLALPAALLSAPAQECR